MVNTITQLDHDKINAAIKDVEGKTSTKIKVIVIPASDHYQLPILLGGLLVGTMISLLLWLTHTLDNYALLLGVQISVVLVVEGVPVLRQLVIALLPRRLLHHHAARLAFQEYHLYQSHISAQEPLVFLFASLAERYVHVMTNPVVHKKIPANWESVTQKFIEAMQRDGVSSASIQAIAQIETILKEAL